MDVLISFYIDGDLSQALKLQVEEHMQSCATCRAKFDIIKSMLVDLKKSVDLTSEEASQKQYLNSDTTSTQYRVFKNNLSAYIDNELSPEENIKIKKFTINNKRARKDLEDSYSIRKLMNESFKKTETELRQDFSRNVLHQLELEDDANFGIHPAIKLLIGFTIIVLVLSSVVLISLSV